MDLPDHLMISECLLFSAMTHVNIVNIVVACEKVIGKDMYAQLASRCRDLDLVLRVEQCLFRRLRHQLHTTPGHAHLMHGVIGRTTVGINLPNQLR